MNAFLQKLGISLPIIQAPMAGTSTPAMAAAVSNAGGLGSIGVAAVGADAAQKMIAALRGGTNQPFNVNVFCHQPESPAPERDAAWIKRLTPEFTRFGATPPSALRELYKSFLEDDAMLAMLLQERPRVVSFHFGLPQAEKVAALRDAGITLFASATNLEEARAAECIGVDAVVAQGYEAGGHRGVFNPRATDERMGTMTLTRLLVKALRIPVIAAGGIMDGAGIAAALALGASAAQLGTAFVACPESDADAAYRSALLDKSSVRTVITTAISGRPARCIVNKFTAFGESLEPDDIAPYPKAYDIGKALIAAAKAKGETAYGAQWAGQGAPMARSLPAGELVAVLADELKRARAV